MRVVIALLKPEGKSEEQMLKKLQDSGFEVHDVALVYVAKTTIRKTD